MSKIVKNMKRLGYGVTTGLYRVLPALRHNAAKPCGCGRTISANKEKCLQWAQRVTK